MSPTSGKKTHHAQSKDNRRDGSGTIKGRKKPVKRRHTYHIEWRGVALVCGVVLALTTASFGFAASMEEKNAFCASCHTSHTTDGQAQTAFLSQGTTDQVCQNCHAVLRGGG